MDGRVTPPWRVTSPTWGPPPPCKQALKFSEYKAETSQEFEIKIPTLIPLIKKKHAGNPLAKLVVTNVWAYLSSGFQLIAMPAASFRVSV